LAVERRDPNRLRYFSTIELVNAQDQEKAAGVAGRLAHQLLNLVVLGELGYFPFRQAGEALLDRRTHHGHIIETGNDSYRFRDSSWTAKTKIRDREHARVQQAKEDAKPAGDTGR
jgi:hypothetical protein